ncbi:hypothetical protein DY000_02029039 [Brassica cretica]|uniref:Uncharacterized protein n=1 Tax=Brassica cretica TaxID=69181 RepID=A0ABQ7DJY6_BRACR|nr:hypothetical protein DY000_02029039 [Brassica cretica]
MKWVRYGLWETASKGRRECMDSCRNDVTTERDGRSVATKRPSLASALRSDRATFFGLFSDVSCFFRRALPTTTQVLYNDTYTKPLQAKSRDTLIIQLHFAKSRDTYTTPLQAKSRDTYTTPLQANVTEDDTTQEWPVSDPQYGSGNSLLPMPRIVFV